MLHGFNFSKLAFIVNISFYVFKYRQFSLPSIPGTYSTLYLCGAHPIKPTVTWLLPDHAIRVKSQKRIERLFWTLNWFSEPNFKIDPFQLAWFSWLLMPWASEKGAEPPGFWNFEQKRLFFSFEWEKTNFTTFAPPPWKNFGKSPSGRPGKSPFDAHVWCITSFRFVFWRGNPGCALIQPHPCACKRASFPAWLAVQADWSKRLTQVRICSVPPAVSARWGF